MGSDKKYHIDFLPAALNDMTEIIAAFAMLGSKNGAVRMKNKMNRAALQISSFPYSGVIVPDDKLAKNGYQMIIVEKHIMFYRIFEDEQKVLFYRVLNGTRNYQSLLRKLNSEAEG